MYTIIEDCSPYYIRFTHDNMDKIIDICKQELPKFELPRTFNHCRLPIDIGKQIINLAPSHQNIEWKIDRVSMFVTKPGRYYAAHKDGLNHRMSLNYTVEILDEDCVTNWYKDEDLNGYEIFGADWPNKIGKQCILIKLNILPLNL